MFFLEKSLIFVAAFAFCEVSCAKITLEQMQQASEPIRMVCIQKTKVSEELLANLRAGKLDDQKELKCYVNCVIEMMQMVRMVELTSRLQHPLMQSAHLPTDEEGKIDVRRGNEEHRHDAA